MKSIFMLCMSALLFFSFGGLTAQAKEKDKDFISLAYVALPFLNLHQVEASQVAGILDKYNWRGISDVALIRGVFMTGRDGSIITSWNKDSWPEVTRGLDYKGDSINEQRHRNNLCSREVVEEVIRYFKDKDIDIWLTQSGYGWLTGGSFAVVLEDSVKIQTYAKRLNRFAKELGCVGLDFDWEFPPTPRQAQGYRQLMRESKRLGMKVSVCAIQPTVGTLYEDQCVPDGVSNEHEARYMKWEEIIDKGMVDHINVMQYLGYDARQKRMNVKVKYDKMRLWEETYPREFTSDRKVDMLCGIGFYSYMLPEVRQKNKETTRKNLNFNQLYKQYGEEAYEHRIVGDEYVVWTTKDVRKIVRRARKKGWKGVFTWLVSHDFTLEHPLKYSRQQALAEEVEKIWKKK